MRSPFVLIVDDEPGVRDLITDALRLSGLDSTTAEHGMEALKKLREHRVDLVILDINMPHMDGYEVLEKMRGTEIHTPVIVLTARLDREDTKRAFELGADDFVRKPFGVEELTLRVRAILRRSQSNDDSVNILRSGSILMNLDQHLVFVDDAAIDLSPTEFRLLHFFLRNPNKVVSKDSLLTEVWGLETYADPNVVETYVSYLRKKFGTDFPLRTVRGVGYQFNDRSPT